MRVTEDQAIEFVRLLAEIRAVGLTAEQLAELHASMDLDTEAICTILERAEEAWEAEKAFVVAEAERAAALRELAERFPGCNAREVVARWREDLFAHVDLPRFQRLEQVGKPGSWIFTVGPPGEGRYAYGLARERLMAAGIGKDYEGARVEYQDRLHVARTKDLPPQTMARRMGLVVTVQWRGLQASREFAVT